MSVIQHPPGARVVRVREDLMAICGGDAGAAVVLDEIDYRSAAAEAVVTISAPHIAAAAASLVCRRTVQHKLAYLIRKGYIIRVPTKNGQRAAYRLDLDRIQEAIRAWADQRNFAPVTSANQRNSAPVSSDDQRNFAPVTSANQRNSAPVSSDDQRNFAPEPAQFCAGPAQDCAPSPHTALPQEIDRSIDLRAVVEEAVMGVLASLTRPIDRSQTPSNEELNLISRHVAAIRDNPKHQLRPNPSPELAKRLLVAAFGAPVFELCAFLHRLNMRLKPDLQMENSDAYLVGCVRTHFQPPEASDPAAALPAPIPPAKESRPIYDQAEAAEASGYIRRQIADLAARKSMR